MQEDDPRQEQQRTARLLFDRELQAGTIDVASLSTSAVRRATDVRRVPIRLLRRFEQVLNRAGRLSYESAVAGPLLAARQTVLGAGSAAPPRFLIRMDEFPHYQAEDDPERFGTEPFERFHEIMHAAGVPYLIAVLPRVSSEPLSPTATAWRALSEGELAMLHRLASEHVSFAMHGLDHRTRFASPQRHSELCGLSAGQLEELLEQGFAELARADIHPQVFVPPFNRFDAEQYDILARRFQVVCGGPESIGTMGFHRTPQWRGGSVYLPSYAPLYGRSREVLPAVERMIDQQAGLWAPVVLHWGWEAEDGWSDLERLAARIAPYAVGWDEFGAAVARSR